MRNITGHRRGKKVRFWSDEELSSAVDVYLKALYDELGAIPYVLSDVITKLQKDALPSRSWRSVELRMKNISSVLYGLKFPFISDCPPAHNVGAGVKDRIVALLYGQGISTLEAYAKTSERDVLEGRVSTLRKLQALPLPHGSLSPKWEAKSIKSFVRDPAIKAWVLRASNGICEGCQSPAHFVGRDGLPYLEVHHVMPLSKHGSDRITNAVALCPNCHTRCHYSVDQDEFKLHLYQTIRRLTVEVPERVGEPTDEFLELD